MCNVDRAVPSELRLIIFFLPLPTVVAIPDGTTYTVELPETLDILKGVAVAPIASAPPFPNADGHNWVSFKVWQVRRAPTNNLEVREVIDATVPEQSRRRASDPSKQESASPRGYVSIVEAVTVLKRKTEGDVSDAFDTCIAALQELLRAYAIASRHAMPTIAREALPFLIPHITRSAFGDDWDDNLSLLILHTNVPDNFLPPLNEQGLRKLGVVYSRIKQGHPMIPYQEARLRARRALMQEGNYQDAVVYAELAVEVLTDAVLTLLLWEEGMPPPDAANTVYTRQLPWRLEQALASRLGGDWRRRGTGPISRWDSRLAFLRGRVIHGAYRPTLQEARECMDIGTEIDEMFRQRIAAKAADFTRTALLILAQPGLRRYNAWTRRVQQAAANADVDAWLIDYRSWRNVLDSHRINLVP